MNSRAILVLIWAVLFYLVCADEVCEVGNRPGEKCAGAKISVPDSAIETLFQLVSESQTRQDSFHFFGQSKINSKGSYKNVIKMHRVGDSIQTALRWAVNINDLNPFVPMGISTILLEAHRYGRAPRPSDDQLLSTLDFCSEFRDVNKPYNNSIMSFWPFFFDEEHQHFFSRPLAFTELINVASRMQNNNRFNINGKTTLGLLLEIINKISNIVTGAGNLDNLLMNIFQLLAITDSSPDTDDTFVWLGLGSALKMSGKEFPKVLDAWIQYNSNISSVFDALKKYAYKPFSADPLVNTIDPTSYYVLREFLDDAKATGNDFAIVTTWLTNAAETLPTDRGHLMHKIINDIDATACANVINGITESVLSGLVDPQVLRDPDLTQIYQNTSSLLAYLINSNFSNRPDLALPYYPSQYQFLWSVARIVSTMGTYKKNRSFPLEVMELVFRNLKHAIEGDGTKLVVSNAKFNDDGSIYFDDFLGNGDVTDDNKPIVRGEDRIFTTAMAANVLMYTWLSFDLDSSKSFWKEHTPEHVKEIVDGCILWLVKNALKGKPWNVLFSTQNKGRDTLSFRYPANVFIEAPQPYPFQYVTNLQVTVGMRGYIPKEEYEAMVNTNHFGKPTPKVFKGFNDPDFSDMMIWSSDAYTYSVTLLALSRYREITTPNIVTKY